MNFAALYRFVFRAVASVCLLALVVCAHLVGFFAWLFNGFVSFVLVILMSAFGFWWLLGDKKK